jgi:hypothetical protein
MQYTVNIVAAAIKCEERIWSLPAPARHADIRVWIFKRKMPDDSLGECGFLLSDGTFARRSVAHFIATQSGQILRKEDESVYELNTEMLW